MTQRRKRLLAGLLALSVLAVAGPAPARDGVPAGNDELIELERLPGGYLAPQDAIVIPFSDAYDDDPMGLVAFAPFVRLFTSGTENWDVWICRGAPALGLPRRLVAYHLNSTTAVFYSEISEGRYTPRFRAGGESSASDCGINTQHSGTTPRLYVNDFSTLPLGGVGGPGEIGFTDDELMYEGLQRRAEVSGDAVTATGYQFSPAGSFTAHELGHTLHWAHSGAIEDYDNELDLMSGGWGSTHAWNLYSAGWIEPEQVALHHGGDRVYTLGPVGFAGTRMVVITTGSQGDFYTLSVRSPDEAELDANSDGAVEKLGVEVYRVDQTPGGCSLPSGAPCFGITALITPDPAQAAPFPGPFPHFHNAGASFEVAGVPITVSAGSGETLQVRVNGGLTGSGVFLDDDDSVFEADIEQVATAGITKGCNPPRNDFYCPEDEVTRGQMAAFLVRALAIPSTNQDFFTDDEGSVFEANINALAAAGITKGCSTTSFCPDDNVTRGQMAAFLNRAGAR
jgi:hypothetical protein